MQQLHNTEKLLGNFKIKLEKGDGTILDVNKVTIQLIEIKKKVKENEFVIDRLKTNLTSYNGGVPVSFEDTSYFEPPAMPLFVELEREYELADPLRKILEQDKSIAQHQIKLSKALSLPKFELGYHYQGILGQTYNGIHTGISIPLWENKNTVKAMKELSKNKRMNTAFFCNSAFVNRHSLRLRKKMKFKQLKKRKFMNYHKMFGSSRSKQLFFSSAFIEPVCS